MCVEGLYRIYTPPSILDIISLALYITRWYIGACYISISGALTWQLQCTPVGKKNRILVQTDW